MHEEIIWELDRCKPKLNEITASIGKNGGESKNKTLYLEGCALVPHYFVHEHILDSKINLISIVVPRMLKWMQFHIKEPESREMGILQDGDSLVGFKTDEHHLPIELKDEETLKGLLRRKLEKEVVEEVAISDSEHPRSSMTFSILITPSHQK